MTNPYHQQYTRVQANTIAPEQLMVMLYEGAVTFLGRARTELEKGALGPGKTALSKGLAIVAELQNSLDLEAGWDGAQNLSDLYSYMIMELTEANLNNDLERIDGVITLLSDLCATWKQAVDSMAQTSQVSAAASGAAMDRAPFKVSV